MSNLVMYAASLVVCHNKFLRKSVERLGDSSDGLLKARFRGEPSEVDDPSRCLDHTVKIWLNVFFFFFGKTPHSKPSQSSRVYTKTTRTQPARTWMG